MKLSLILLLAATVAVHAQMYEQRVVAAVICAEAGGQGKIGMSAVAEVIHERSVQTGTSPFQVVTKGTRRNRAFSCLIGRSPAGLVKKYGDYPGYKDIALPLATQVHNWPTNWVSQTRNATFFTRKEERPYWSKGRSPVAVIGDHAFYRILLRRKT